MGFVAVSAHHPFVKHMALQKGPVHIHFVVNLTIRVIKRVVEQRNTVG